MRFTSLIFALAATATQGASAGAWKCSEERGGTCVDTTAQSCATGTVVPGLCTGGTEVKCCVPYKREAEKKCLAQGGSCLRKDSSECKTGSEQDARFEWKGGMCPGSSRIKCCLPTADPSARTDGLPAIMSDNGPSDGTGLLVTTVDETNRAQCAKMDVRNRQVPFDQALFNKMWNAYTPYEEDVNEALCIEGFSTDAFKKKIGGNVDADYIKNSCAVRTSAVLNAGPAALHVPNNFRCSQCSSGKMLTVRGGGEYRGQRFALRVAELTHWVNAKLGSPIVVKASEFAHLAPEKREAAWRAKFNCNSGIVRFIVVGWSDATGHFDLWNPTVADGKGGFGRCSGHCYWHKAGEPADEAHLQEVHFWPATGAPTSSADFAKCRPERPTEEEVEEVEEENDTPAPDAETNPVHEEAEEEPVTPAEEEEHEAENENPVVVEEEETAPVEEEEEADKPAVEEHVPELEEVPTTPEDEIAEEDAEEVEEVVEEVNNTENGDGADVGELTEEAIEAEDPALEVKVKEEIKTEAKDVVEKEKEIKTEAKEGKSKVVEEKKAEVIVEKNDIAKKEDIVVAIDEAKKEPTKEAAKEKIEEVVEEKIHEAKEELVKLEEAEDKFTEEAKEVIQVAEKDKEQEIKDLVDIEADMNKNAKVVAEEVKEIAEAAADIVDDGWNEEDTWDQPAYWVDPSTQEETKDESSSALAPGHVRLNKDQLEDLQEKVHDLVNSAVPVQK